MHFRSSAVRLEVSCDINEIYDPFKGKCLSVDSDFNHENTSEQELCRGPRIPSSEFLLLANHSVYVIPHQKVYNNDSFIEINTYCLLELFPQLHYNKRKTWERSEPKSRPNANFHRHHLCWVFVVDYFPCFPFADVFPVWRAADLPW